MTLHGDAPGFGLLDEGLTKSLRGGSTGCFGFLWVSVYIRVVGFPDVPFHFLNCVL